MKKITLFIGIVLCFFALTSCDNSASKMEGIMAEVENYFAQAEQQLEPIDNAEDFLAFYDEFSDGQNAFLESLNAKFPTDENGKFKGLTQEQTDEVNSKIYERASAFNKKTAAKCSEYLTPLIDKLEVAANNAKEEFDTTGNISETTRLEVGNAIEDVLVFADFDNVPKVLQNRYAQITSILESIAPEEYPEGEEE